MTAITSHISIFSALTMSKHRHAVHAELVTSPFLSIATCHLNLYASDQKLVRRKYTATLPFLGSHFLTFWVSPDFFVAVTSDLGVFARRQSIAWLGSRLTELAQNILNNNLQAKAVCNRSSASYGVILLQYLTACRLEFGLMPTLKGVFSLFASQENNRKFFPKFLLGRNGSVGHTFCRFVHTLGRPHVCDVLHNTGRVD